MPPFEDFVNTELPLRVSISTVPTANNFPRFNGVGRASEERTPAQVLNDISGASASDLSDHLDDFANPHLVDQTDVGLSNVTNDAQLKRSAADFTTFTEKTSPVAADKLLIEDSAASHGKKYVQISKLPVAISQLPSGVIRVKKQFRITNPADNDRYHSGGVCANRKVVRVAARAYGTASETIDFNIGYVADTDPEGTPTWLWSSDKTVTVGTPYTQTDFSSDSPNFDADDVLVIDLDNVGAINTFWVGITCELR